MNSYLCTYKLEHYTFKSNIKYLLTLFIEWKTF